MAETPELFQDLAHQAPVLVLYVVSAFAALKMFLSHLRSESASMGKVLALVADEMKKNTIALTGLAEVVRGMQANTIAMDHLLTMIKGIKGGG